jgi:hypothetical protein
MNSINLLNVPSDCRLFCLVNYNAFGSMLTESGTYMHSSLPQLEKPIIASNLAEARKLLAKRLGISADMLSQWEEVGEDDGFTPSLSIGYKTATMEAGYSFDVYTTVNALYLLES